MDANQKMHEVMSNNTQLGDEEEEALPGFRFHPTDQELVGFYLRRKVDKKSLNIDLIKQIDIYKYDPWDLPQGTDLGEKEWYFFCRRGRKYRNSIRPNRVTGSGFWKATGIDRPIYSNSSAVCIGLKKSLVYYRGNAGKGTKTEWMMHEFRLPPSSHQITNIHIKNITHMEDKSLSQEAEVWTLCRILKRNVSHRKSLPDWRELSAKRNSSLVDTSPKACSADSDQDMQSYISFQPPLIQLNHDKNALSRNHNHFTNGMNQLSDISRFTSSSAASDQAPSATASSSSFSDLDMNEFIKHGDWDDLRSVVEFAATEGPVLFM